jgi:hypothetical protein
MERFPWFSRGEALMKTPRAPAARLGNMSKSRATTALPVVRPSSAPTTARRPQRGDVAARLPKAKSGFGTLLQRCYSNAAAAKQSELKSLEDTSRALESIYRLHLHSRSDPAAKQALELEYKEAGIRRSGNTTTEFTLPVKLFFGKDQPRPTISRVASTLQLALEAGVKPQDFVAFVWKNHGTAACARLLTQERRKAKVGTAENPRGAASQSVREHVADAPKIRFPKELGAYSEPYIMLHAEREADGSYTVQWCRGIPARVIDEWARMMEATPTGGVGHTRR